MQVKPHAVLAVHCNYMYYDIIQNVYIHVHDYMYTYCMNPPAKKEGNSRQRRLGCPLRVDSIKHLNKDVVCRVSYTEEEGMIRALSLHLTLKATFIHSSIKTCPLHVCTCSSG